MQRVKQLTKKRNKHRGVWPATEEKKGNPSAQESENVKIRGEERVERRGRNIEA